MFEDMSKEDFRAKLVAAKAAVSAIYSPNWCRMRSFMETQVPLDEVGREALDRASERVVKALISEEVGVILRVLESVTLAVISSLDVQVQLEFFGTVITLGGGREDG